MNKNIIMAVLATSVALAGCANTQERRIARGLEAAGLGNGLSRCMAERMVENLSGSQLRAVDRFMDTLEDDVDDMTVGEIARAFGPIGDGGIVTVMVRAGAGCAISG